MSRNAALGLLVAFLLILLLVMVRVSKAGTGDQLVRGFLCIHRYEGRWDANTGNGYYGGLQMDLSFQRAYGREFLAAFGTANNWPIPIQIAVAVRAHLSGRGWGPWPSTARRCGLV